MLDDVIGGALGWTLGFAATFAWRLSRQMAAFRSLSCRTEPLNITALFSEDCTHKTPRSRATAATQNNGMRRFTLRGQKKVSAQWKLFTMVHNIEKVAGVAMW
jgi:hypothetical protein